MKVQIWGLLLAMGGLGCSPVYSYDLSAMTLRDKVAQLFVVGLHSTPEPDEWELVKRLVTQYHVGGILFHHPGTIARQVELTSMLQLLSLQFSCRPLLITQDCEWGLAMRLSDGMRFPRAMTLGALNDTELIYEVGKEIGRQCRCLGVQVNFAPVADINSNPLNPIIGMRSFGDNKFDVASKSIAYMRGLRHAGVIPCAKHFPGHGAVAVDSHLALPIVEADAQQLDVVELYPFKQLIAAGVPAIMVAHLSVPALDQCQSLPTSLSKAVVTDLLRSKLGFNGVIFTDGLEMGGVTSCAQPGEIEIRALLAGNDVLLFSPDAVTGIETVVSAVEQGILSEELINQKVEKMLALKSRAFASRSWRAAPKELDTDFARELKEQLYREAITLVQGEVLPAEPVHYIQIGGCSQNTFERRLRRYTTSDDRDGVPVIAVFDKPQQPIDCSGAYVVLFCTPYVLPLIHNAHTIIEAYEDDPDAQRAAVDVLLSKIKPQGHLPITLPSIH